MRKRVSRKGSYLIHQLAGTRTKLCRLINNTDVENDGCVAISFDHMRVAALLLLFGSVSVRGVVGAPGDVTEGPNTSIRKELVSDFKFEDQPRGPILSPHLISPAEAGFFSKELFFEAIPIKAHKVVSDGALVEAYARLFQTFESMGLYREIVIGNLVRAQVEVHIIGKAQVTTDLPEWNADKGKPLPEYNGLTRDQRTRGMGGRLMSCGEENLLRLPEDRYQGRDIFVHEFSHCIRNFGMSTGLRQKFDERYQRAIEKGLWVGAYSSTNPDEFFAELSMWYFGTHGDLEMKGVKPKPGRNGLRAYDPETFVLFDDFYQGRAPF
jgi:hypothetical protein